MMPDRSAQAPAEIVIWGSTAALGIVTGTGAAYALWTQLHRSPDMGIVVSAVCALALGLGLLGFAMSSSRARLFLVVVAAALALAYFAGAGTFATLTS